MVRAKLVPREICRYQRSCELLIPKTRFRRLVQEIVQEIKTDARLQRDAVIALQEASESHLIRLFQKSNYCAMKAKRVTLTPDDFESVRRILRDDG